MTLEIKAKFVVRPSLLLHIPAQIKTLVKNTSHGPCLYISITQRNMHFT